MDTKTREYYDKAAASLSQRYDAADLSELHALLRQWLPRHARVLEVGCGTGRDALFMTSLGCAVTALDGSPSMVALTREAFSRQGMDPSRVFLTPIPFPSDHELLAEKFDAVVAVAVLMHLENSELSEWCSQVGTLLREEGIFICSFSSGKRGKNDERLFIHRQPEEVQLLFESAGWSLLCQKETPHGLGRNLCWYNLIFFRYDTTC